MEEITFEYAMKAIAWNISVEHKMIKALQDGCQALRTALEAKEAELIKVNTSIEVQTQGWHDCNIRLEDSKAELAKRQTETNAYAAQLIAGIGQRNARIFDLESQQPHRMKYEGSQRALSKAMTQCREQQADKEKLFKDAYEKDQSLTEELEAHAKTKERLAKIREKVKRLSYQHDRRIMVRMISELEALTDPEGKEKPDALR